MTRSDYWNRRKGRSFSWAVTMSIFDFFISEDMFSMQCWFKKWTVAGMQNPNPNQGHKKLSLCIVHTNWFRDYHLDNFSCPWGLFTQFSHINILLIGSFYLLRSSLGNERWYHITYKLNHGHLFWKLSPSTICLSGLLWRQAAKGRPKQLWETNHGGRKFSKLWPEGSMYLYVICVLNNTFGQFIRFHLFSNSDNIVLWHPH